MAIHEYASPKLPDDEDDDDVPMVFKRNNAPSKQGHDIFSSKGSSQMASQSSNGENAYTRKNKSIPSSNSVRANSSSGHKIAQTSKPERSNSLLEKHASPNMPVAHAASSDDSDDDKPLNFRKPASVNKKSDAMHLDLPKHEPDNYDDSDDHKPLSSSFGAAANSSAAQHSLQAKGMLNSQRTSSSLPLKIKENSSGAQTSSSRVPTKPNVQSVSNELYDSDEEPLFFRLKRNASSKVDAGTSGKTSAESKKRYPIDAKNLLPSNKKAKPSGNSRSDVKKEPIVKEEMKKHDTHEDFEEDLPILQKFKKTVSQKKETPMKKSFEKVKATTSFKKKNKQIKKGAKKLELKHSKAPPGSGEGQKWTTLVHNGVIFPPPYQPHGIKMLYNGKPVDLTTEQEEVATMFAVMKDTEYATKKTFTDNFFNDWKAILGKSHVIQKLELCDFTPIYEWHLREKEKKKQMTSEEKKALKEEKMQKEDKYMWATVDGVKEKVGNFRVEPPGLFRGRGEHPKMGKLKKRIRPRDITINIGKDAPIPECPIAGERWKEVRHDNTVTWLAYWNDPINTKEFKYVFLAASSSLKGQSDKEKYEKARKLKDYIQSIRARYTKDFTSRDEAKRQIAVATYLIDKLALRAGNEKDDDEADTVGCCTLKVENVTLVPPNKLQFDFLGKDSIRYFNTVEVELPVFKAIGEFQKGGKEGSDDLFDKLDTAKLNTHLKELMPGLTAKVFRTYNASITLDEMLSRETGGGSLPEKVAVYQSANKEVAIICNHQRSVSKNHDVQMSRLDDKIDDLKSQQEELRTDLSRAKKGKSPLKGADGKPKRNLGPEMIQKKLSQLAAKIEKMELDKKIKEDLKTVALGTSKINYLDPRISVAWCKRHEVPIEKIFNKSLLAKFSWAMDVDPSFRF